jgi:hypothetical protein
MMMSIAVVGFAGLFGNVNANIPFDFMVGGKEFKAGEYTIKRLYANNPDAALLIRGKGNDATLNFNANNVTDKVKGGARLVFHRYGNQYFLAQIFDGQSGQGSGLVTSKAERDAAKKGDTITQNHGEPESVTIVAQVGR